MTERDERPLFVDPVGLGSGDDVDDAPVPGWFVLLALTVLAVAAYYLFSFAEGPRASSPHELVDGRSAPTAPASASP